MFWRPGGLSQVDHWPAAGRTAVSIMKKYTMKCNKMLLLQIEYMMMMIIIIIIIMLME
jgi:hypothetical protein